MRELPGGFFVDEAPVFIHPSTMTREQVLAAARELSPEDRELLVYDLTQELDPAGQERIELLWREEIRRRHADRLSGREPSHAGESVLAELRELHGGS